MKHYTKEEIIAKCSSIWADAFGKYRHGEIEVQTNTDNKVVIVVSQMYEYVEMNLSHLMKLAKFFGTTNITDSRYSTGGCETCDYGSSYEITLTIKPEKQ